MITGLLKPDFGSIIIDNKNVRVSKDGYFVFGIDRDRKFDLTITELNEIESIIQKYIISLNSLSEFDINSPLF